MRHTVAGIAVMFLGIVIGGAMVLAGIAMQVEQPTGKSEQVHPPICVGCECGCNDGKPCDCFSGKKK